MRKYSFCVRVVGPWNCLGHDTVNTKSLNIFKRRLDDEMDKWEYKYE